MDTSKANHMGETEWVVTPTTTVPARFKSPVWHHRGAATFALYNYVLATLILLGRLLGFVPVPGLALAIFCLIAAFAGMAWDSR